MEFGGIEAGGTKFVCGIGNEQGEIIDRFVTPTQDPGDTLDRVVAYFNNSMEKYSLRGIGLASFGPVDLNPDSDTYGYITSTPKKRWQYFDIKGELERSLGFEIPFDTDVNGAVLAEHLWGGAQGVKNAVYITVGTGIGGGVMVEGQLIHGLLHPELGHMRLRGPEGADFKGICPFHDYCLEGLAAGPAIEARWNQAANTLAPDHPAWELEAAYLAEGISNIILTLSPEVIILGGGVMHQKFLFPLIRKKVQQLLNGYVHKPEILDNIHNYIIPPGLGDQAGLLGAVALAIRNG
jgi:fructokinase